MADELLKVISARRRLICAALACVTPPALDSGDLAEETARHYEELYQAASELVLAEDVCAQEFERRAAERFAVVANAPVSQETRERVHREVECGMRKPVKLRRLDGPGAD